MKERLSSKHSDNFTYNIVCITPSSPPDYQKNGTQNQGREHEISETGLEEGARGAGYPQILHKTAYGGSTSQKPPKVKRAMQLWIQVPACTCKEYHSPCKHSFGVFHLLPQ